VGYQSETILMRSADVPSRAVDGKGILVDLESGYYFSLNRTGQFIWEQFDGSRTLHDIARLMVDQFDVDEETSLSDCIELADRLGADGLVVTAKT
jgi:hypothetical protein